MKTIICGLTAVVVAALAPMAGATVITGNQGSWGNNDFESAPSGIFPLIQNITIPAPPSGTAWQVDSVTLTSWRASSGTSTGWEVYLAPGGFANGDPWVDASPGGANTAIGHASFGGPLGVDDTPWPGPFPGATVNTVSFDASFTATPGSYYLDIRPTGGSGLNLARDAAANTYPGGAEGYFQPSGPSVGINPNHDLIFQIEGIAIPEPATIGLLVCGGLLLGGCRRRLTQGARRR